jgi:hypothetical protein
VFLMAFIVVPLYCVIYMYYNVILVVGINFTEP